MLRPNVPGVAVKKKLIIAINIKSYIITCFFVIFAHGRGLYLSQ